MAAWNAFMSVGLNSLGDHYGISGLGDLFDGLFSSSDDELKDILKELDQIASDVSEIKQRLDRLALYVENMKVVEYYTKIESSFEDVIALSQQRSKKGTDLKKLRDNMARVAKDMADPTNGIKNVCDEMSAFLVGNDVNDVAFVSEIAKSNVDKTFVPYYMSVRTACAKYALAYHKAIACVRWMAALSKVKDVDFGFVTDAEWIRDIEAHIHALSHAFTKEIPMSAERIFNHLNDLPTHGTTAHPTFRVDNAFPAWPSGVRVRISSAKYRSKKLNIKMLKFRREDPILAVRADDDDPGGVTFYLAPVTPFHYASVKYDGKPEDKDKDIHFCLFWFQDILGNAHHMLGNSKGILCAQNWNSGTAGGETVYPPRFQLYLNHDGTFSLQWYSDRSSGYGETHHAGHFPKIERLDKSPLREIPFFFEEIEDELNDMVYSDDGDSKKFDRSSEEQKFILQIS
ncbi:hypothetical protein [Eilatimonas milleporae]|nr:hypothetical protein [Eilatimonas milleporae]